MTLYFFRSLSPAFLSSSTLTVNADGLRLLTCSTSLPSESSSPGLSRIGPEIRVRLTCVPFVLSRSSMVAVPETTVIRSEEHTSELQSHLNLVCRLLLGKNIPSSDLLGLG